MEYGQFSGLLFSGKPAHLAGIGGVSMSALAGYLHARGVTVQGSDRSESPATRRLRGMGIHIFIGHEATNITNAVLVIRTAAIGDGNAEIAAAKSLGIPVLERAEAWGFIMRGYKDAVCVAGTHGKTSVTGMIALVAIEAETDPVVMVGGDLAAIGGTLRDGAGELIVAEACEYKNSFLSFCPTVAVILNIDDDHVDFFSSSDDIISSFKAFVGMTPETGTVIVNRDDARAMAAANISGRQRLTFGWGTSADIYPANITSERGLHRFDIMHSGKKYASARLAVPGRHSVSNALAAAAVAVSLGISGQAFERGIEQFTGVSRRFEHKKHWHGADIYDDYSHHPTEIAACIQTARSLNPKRLVCVFQPHTYSRTKAFMSDFAAALGASDKVLLCPIYAAREAPIEGVSSDALAKLTRGSECFPSMEAAAEALARDVREGDLILLMGAGDINLLCDML